MKVHVGSGKVYLPGFTNVDLFQNVSADVYADMMHLPFDRGSCELIYSSHVLEHQHRHMVLATLNYWASLLKPGGTLRLAVPDFAAVCAHYTKFHDIKLLHGLMYGGQDSHLNRHTTAFDKTYLTELLTQAGFVDIEPWDWRTTEHRASDDFSRAYLPHRDETGILMSLNLQAKLPL